MNRDDWQRADALAGSPVPRLLEIAADADLLVVGNRGRGGFASLLLGSVSQRLALHALCPIVVVRGDGRAGPVAVGVDDSAAADQVLDAALTAAAERGCGVLAIRTYLPPIPLWLASDVPAVEVQTPEPDAIERERLESQLLPVGRSTPTCWWRHRLARQRRGGPGWSVEECPASCRQPRARHAGRRVRGLHGPAQTTSSGAQYASAY